MELIQYPQQCSDKEVVKKIVALENMAWNNNGDTTFPRSPHTYVTSFVLIENDIAICHVGIRKCNLYHKGEIYKAYGLSEVVTHPHYRKRGLASFVINEAFKFILTQDADMSLFTCNKERVRFYTRCGWKAIQDSYLIGGTIEKPFRSDDLGLITMIKFISSKSHKHKDDFQNTDIVLELGEDQLW